ncbi:MAG: methionyl-tRNA formyltransferase [Dehalococcoidia bacterium]|nr:methionyl-tRNA formyltransferase [Dehalococcoidia bacterium]
MRVSIIGQAAFGEAVFRRLQDDGIEIAGVSAPKPGEGARPDPLWAAAEAANLPLVPTAELKDEARLAAWRDLNADLCVMAFVTDILPDEVFGLPRLGTIQYHPSLLPLHRGNAAMNWAIVNGDRETGLTIFWPDKGIDTGPILLQKQTEIGPEDTVASLYFERLFPMGVDAMVEAVELVAKGKARRIEQDHAKATYEPPMRDPQAEIRWYEPAERIHRLIRGCNPQPGAWTMFNGEKLRIFDCRLTGQQEAGMPGRVLRIDEDGFDMRLNGGVLRVLRVQPAGAKKLPAGEWAANVGLKAGFRFR